MEKFRTFKDMKQAEVVEEYCGNGEPPLRCSAVLSTGFGKSKLSIDIIKRLNPSKVLILVNSDDLRRYSWKEEFEKFDYIDKFNDDVIVETYQSACKWRRSEKNLDGYFVVADEVDFAASTEVYSNFFYEYPELRILGLTGFITEAKYAWFNTHLPVFYHFTAQQAQDEYILNRLHFTFVKIDLSRNKSDITVKRKNGSTHFTQSQNDAYDYIQRSIDETAKKIKDLETQYFTAKDTLDILDYQIQTAKLESKIRSLASRRREILLGSKTSIETAKGLINYSHENIPDSKVVVFSKRTSTSEQVVGPDHTYNGKKSQKLNKTVMDKFRSGDTNVLGVCDKINRGVNIPGLNVAVFESFFGSDTKATQRFGRLLRLPPKQVGVIFVILPYYTSKEDNHTTSRKTKQVDWATSMIRSTKITSHNVWDYRLIKNELK